jgi:hypothetical protein
VEFSVQLLQLVHGGRDPALRLRATLPCLDEMADAGYVAAEDAAALAIAYRFLRTVEHRLQLVEEAQVHTVPADRASRDRLARVLGFKGRPRETPGDRFDAVLARHQGTGRPSPEPRHLAPLPATRTGQQATTFLRRTPPRSGSPRSASQTPSGPARP